MAERDYYDVLGVARDAKPDAIKKAYRNLARKHHPDVNPGDKKAEALFKEAQQAYDVLSDAEKRAMYDQYGRAAFEGMAAGPRPGAGTQGWGFPPGQAGPGFETFDFNDLLGQGAGGESGGGGAGIFEELLGRMRGGGGRTARRPVGPRPGRNLEAEVAIPFLTAVRGGETAIQVSREGRNESLSVKIPPGVDTGARLRLRGQGEPGEKGATPGDLTIQITVEPHPYFTREGRNLTVDVPITVAEAVAGAKVDVPTLDGQKSLTIPAGTSSGQKLRLRAQGLPASGDRPEGDLFIIVKVVVPKSVDDESRRLIQEFAERNPQNPRGGLW